MIVAPKKEGSFSALHVELPVIHLVECSRRNVGLRNTVTIGSEKERCSSFGKDARKSYTCSSLL